GFIDTLVEQRGLVISTSERTALVEDIYRGKLEESLESVSERYYKQQFRPCRLIILLDDLHRGLGHDTLKELASTLVPVVSPKGIKVNVSLVLSGELPLEQEFRGDVSSL